MGYRKPNPHLLECRWGFLHIHIRRNEAAKQAFYLPEMRVTKSAGSIGQGGI